MQNLDGRRGLAPQTHPSGLTANGGNQHHHADAAANGGGQTRADSIAAWTAAMWDRLEANARALDRSEAQHILRLRANHSAAQRRHVRIVVTR